MNDWSFLILKKTGTSIFNTPSLEKSHYRKENLKIKDIITDRKIHFTLNVQNKQR